MTAYLPPYQDMRFVLSELLDAPQQLAALPAHADMDQDLMIQIIDEAGRFASEVVYPLHAPGDREGCHYEDGQVRTPQGYAQAYRQFCAAGWPALACDPAYGGQGLPQTLNCVLYEMLSSASHAWTMFPGLLHGAYACLHQHASAELKNLYLPRIVSGEWLATMCLTEPQAGSDLGLLRTQAQPQPDGSVRISGSKIFISGGEHDLTANIVHLVLARLPDAAPGSKGISLFLVPKHLPGPDGQPGQRNAVHCTGIEHKMGIHGSATCSMQFDGATGWMVGEPGKGLAAMFIMMNAARLAVGLQGLGTAQVAYQQALAYAQERLQMRAAVRPASDAGQPADPIIHHPPVQRLLMTQRACIEGGRMLAYWSALLLDVGTSHPEAEARLQADALLSLLTPVVKSMLTEQGFLGASQAMQIFGGHGYITETGIEQYMRDARIAMIYEGTNEIQAIDLVLRKILADQGARLRAFFALVQQTLDQPAGHAEIHDMAARLGALLQNLDTLVQDLAAAQRTEPDLAHRIAPEMLRLVGHVALSWLWLRAARIASDAHKQEQSFYRAKLDTARYYFDYLLPETRQLLEVAQRAVDRAQTGKQLRLMADVLEPHADTSI